MNVVDSSAWLEYFANGPNAAFFATAVEKIDDLMVPSLTIYEVFKRVLQQRNEGDALQAVAVMQQGGGRGPRCPDRPERGANQPGVQVTNGGQRCSGHGESSRSDPVDARCRPQSPATSAVPKEETLGELEPDTNVINDQEWRHLPRVFDSLVPAIPSRPLSQVRAEMDGVRVARRGGGGGHRMGAG